MKRSALVLIVSDQARVLAVTNRNHGGFGLPGGKVDKGETSFDAVVREVREELGVTMGGLTPVLQGEWKRSDLREVCVFHAGKIYGTPRACEAGTEIRWLEYRELHELSPFAEFYRQYFPGGFDHLKATRLL